MSYDRFAWHGSDTVRVQRLAADRFGYFVETRTGNGTWRWVAAILVYSATNIRVHEGRLTDDELWDASGLTYDEYRSRPIEEK